MRNTAESANPAQQPRPAARPLRAFRFGGLAVVLAAASAAVAQPAASPSPAPAGATVTLVATPAGAPITLSELVRRVLERNESVQSKILEFELNRRRHAAELGIFEPEGFGTATREVNNRQNNAQQAAGTGVSILNEKNWLYSTGVELFVPTGARIRMGYTLSDLDNNIPPGPFQAPIAGHQYQSFGGLTLTQPLLKNFGKAASMANIRLAALSSNIAFQEYRRQLMTTVGTAEATYWTLHLAQEQVRFFEESLRTAETILRDNRARLDAGKVSDLDVLEAQAGVGLRRAKLNEARQKLAEAISRVVSLYAETVAASGEQIRVIDVPRVDAARSLDEMRQQALAFNPDYLIQREKIQQELVRVAYARNQRRPELNLKGSYGLNGLGTSPYSSLRYIEHAQYPSWSVGLEVRVPLMGGVRGRNDSKAAELRRTAAELAIRSLHTDMLNGMSVAAQKVERARSSIESYEAAVKFNQTLLDSALVRLDAGKIESRKVLEIEADLFEAKNAVVESLVRFKIAQLEFELVAGTVLENRQLEISQRQLQVATEKFTRAKEPGDEHYRRALQGVQNLYPAVNPSAAAPTPAATPRKSE